MRGRPPLVMTHHRRMVLACYADLIARGHPINFARIARRCGLYDYREARRIVHDLRKMGAISAT